jgi:hypothetical protein
MGTTPPDGIPYAIPCAMPVEKPKKRRFLFRKFSRREWVVLACLIVGVSLLLFGLPYLWWSSKPDPAKAKEKIRDKLIARGWRVVQLDGEDVLVVEAYRRRVGVFVRFPLRRGERNRWGVLIGTGLQLNGDFRYQTIVWYHDDKPVERKESAEVHAEVDDVVECLFAGVR